MKKPDARGFIPPQPWKISELCDAAGIPRQDLAQRIGLSDRALRAYTNGETPIPYAAWYCLRALAEK